MHHLSVASYFRQRVGESTQGNSMFQSAEVVGWVELRETHHEFQELVGLVKLDPPYILKNRLALESTPQLLLSGSPVFSKLLLPGMDEVQRFTWGDFVDIRRANFVQKRMLFVAEEGHLPLARAFRTVAIG
jgi:hypothetical protein